MQNLSSCLRCNVESIRLLFGSADLIGDFERRFTGDFVEVLLELDELDDELDDNERRLLLGLSIEIIFWVLKLFF